MMGNSTPLADILCATHPPFGHLLPVRDEAKGLFPIEGAHL